MQPKPKQWREGYASVFQETSVARAYEYRPPYPAPIFQLLDELAGDRPRAILDVGCGTGELARGLTPFADRVDAVDVSRPMIEIGKTLPRGDAAHLHWICSRMEDAPLHPPYSLIVAGDSLHWMDWAVVLPRLHRSLHPGGFLALVTRGWGTGVSEETEIFSRYSTNQDFQRISLIAELARRGLFEQRGEREMPPAPWRPTVAEYIEARHSQSAFSRERMAPADVAAFDAALETLLRRLIEAGSLQMTENRLELDVRTKVTWGLPLDPL